MAAVVALAGRAGVLWLRETYSSTFKCKDTPPPAGSHFLNPLAKLSHFGRTKCGTPFKGLEIHTVIRDSSPDTPK